MALQDQIRDAGVVGAGGAGFPAHVKAAARVDTVIANGAECEPLIHKDVELMGHFPGEIIRGLKLLLDATGASRGILGVKEKNAAAINALRAAVNDSRISLHLLGDFYPSGDEYVLVYEATGRLIPPQGIPLAIGIVVNNVETLYNVARAAEGAPVTEKFVSVSGAVRKPVTFRAPVGMTYRDAIAVAGGTTAGDVAAFASGIMMGTLEVDLQKPITKTCAGIVVLPLEHTLVRRKRQPEHEMHRIGKSACDQCSYCTELCPRYLLGYDVQPHKVMRSLGFTKSGDAFWNQFAALCCACGLCTLYACPENLFPKEACDGSKAAMKSAGMVWSGRGDIMPHAMYEGRRTPLRQLVKKLGVTEYDCPTPFLERIPSPDRVTIPLLQHVGVAAVPTVRPGDRVRKGDTIGEIPPGKQGARLHASIDGVVSAVDGAITITRRKA